MLFNPVTRVISRTNKIVKKTLHKMTGPAMVSAQTLSDRAFLASFNLDEVLEPLQQGDTLAAQEALLAHYGQRVTPGWPAFPEVISDQEIKIYQLSQAELIARAEAVLENRPYYGLFDEPLLTPAGTIDWSSDPNPSDSLEGLWLLNRHSWWPVLALAYAQTGDERYATAFVSQMLDWIETNPPPARKDEKSPAWRLMETGLRLRISWIPSFAIFYHSPAFTAEARLKMLRSIYDHARFLFLFKTVRNHLLRESNGLAYAGTYFPEFAEAGLWQQTALSRLEAELREQINRDGSHIEMSTGYQWLVIDEFQTTYDLLQAHRLSLPTENLGEWLEKMYQVLAYLIRPDRTFPQLNDGFLFWDYTGLARAGESLGRDEFTYIGSGGRRGACPAETSMAFSDAGLHVMRSDWSRAARYLLFDAGPYGGPHGHEDKLNIEIFAFGQPFIVDPGSYTYDPADPFRTYFVSSAGHNLVLVDGRSQVRRWQKENLTPRPAAGDYATWLSRPDFDYVAATYDEGYGHFSFKAAGDAVLENVIHTRHILFVKPDYWLIVDQLQASRPHDYQVLFHAFPGLIAHEKAGHTVVLSPGPEAAQLYLLPATPEAVQVSFSTGSEAPIQGWCAIDYHCKVPSTAIIYEAKGQTTTTLTTLLYPCPNGHGDDLIKIAPLDLSHGQGSAYVVTTPRGRDYLMLSSNEALKQFGAYQARGVVAGRRLDQEGNLISQFEGTMP